jgi:hypothetical protein
MSASHDTMKERSPRHHSLCGQPKGAEEIFENVDCDRLCFHLECPKSGGREGCQAEGNKELATGYCGRDVLTKEPDFQAQRGRFVEELEASNQRVIFHPKFHCELNLIGRFNCSANEKTVVILLRHYERLF